MPGQFVGVSVPGIGEAPISISSSPDTAASFEMVVRKVGRLTEALHALPIGATLGIRGPLGTAFPVDTELKGKDLLIICGGLGLVPVRSAIQYVLNRRQDYGDITIIYGSRAPADRLFLSEIETWRATEGVTYLETVDRGDEAWKGHVGVITTLLPQVPVSSVSTRTIICGPPIMYKFVITGLTARGDTAGAHLRLTGTAHEMRRRQVRPLPDQRSLRLYRWAGLQLCRIGGCSGGNMSKPRVAIFDFACCEGCQLQIVNMEEELLKLLEHIKPVEWREAMSEQSEEYDIAIIEGSICRESDEERLKTIRQRAKILIALGACASMGGVNKLVNTFDSLDEVKRCVYGDSARMPHLITQTGEGGRRSGAGGLRRARLPDQRRGIRLCHPLPAAGHHAGDPQLPRMRRVQNAREYLPFRV